MFRYIFMSLVFVVFFISGCQEGVNNNALSGKSIAPNNTILEKNGDLTRYIATPRHKVVLDLESIQGHKNDTEKVGSDVELVSIPNVGYILKFKNL